MAALQEQIVAPRALLESKAKEAGMFTKEIAERAVELRGGPGPAAAGLDGWPEDVFTVDHDSGGIKDGPAAFQYHYIMADPPLARTPAIFRQPFAKYARDPSIEHATLATQMGPRAKHRLQEHPAAQVERSELQNSFGGRRTRRSSSRTRALGATPSQQRPKSSRKRWCAI